MGEATGLERMSDAEILGIANPIMDNLMDASTEIDHERHIRDFTERLKRIATKEYPQRVCEQYQREKGFLPSVSRLLSSGARERQQLSGSSGSPKPLESSLPRCFSWSRTESISSTTSWCSERRVSIA